MESGPLPRKLAAILYADVAGYSRLTGEDEDATHRRLAEYLDQITVNIDHHGGRVMHYAGDAVLAMFDAVVDALFCAARIQKDLKMRNADLPDERKVQFRIGVNLGDVIEDRGDIYGDGVNVAARLESLAEPGGICISESVHTAVGSKLSFDYAFLGEQKVKNISKPVRAYSARLKPEAALPTPTPRPKPRRAIHPVMAATAAVVVLAITAGVITWWQPWEPREELASIDRMAFPLPDKPSIAVLPFTNISADADQEYFADGITEDLITDLSKLSGLFVISRTSTSVYKGKPVNVKQVAEDLGVRYVLEGSVRRNNDEIRINAQLIDAVTGGHLWAERYNRPMRDVFDVQDDVRRNVVTALAVHLTPGEREAQRRAETDNVEAYRAFLRGRSELDLYTRDSLLKAIAHFEEALRLDPNFTRVYGGLAAALWGIWNNSWFDLLGMSQEESWENLEQVVAKAMENPTPRGLNIYSRVLNRQGKFEEAIAVAEQAVALDPGDESGYRALGRALIKSGRPAEGLAALEKVRRFNPRGDDSGGYAYRIAEALWLLERYDEAETEIVKYLERSGDEEWGSFLSAAIYGQLGRNEEAKAALDKFDSIRAARGIAPHTLKRFDSWTSLASDVRAHYVESMRKAGMPPGE